MAAPGQGRDGHATTGNVARRILPVQEWAAMAALGHGRDGHATTGNVARCVSPVQEWAAVAALGHLARMAMPQQRRLLSEVAAR